MNAAILNKEVQDYIKKNLNADVHKIMMSKSPFTDVSTRELAEQIDSKRRSEKKLPSWFNTEGIYYPSKLSIEQTSSEITASYKAQLIKGGLAIDLTGGFGVDSYYFSQTVEKLIHCELNEELSDITHYNLAKLGAKNIEFICGDGLSFLKNTSLKFDTIYIDPSRRVENKKVFMLHDTEPDVIGSLPLLLEKSERVVIKTSPMLDIQEGLRDFKNHVAEIHVLSYKNECKELLWVLSPQTNPEPNIYCVLLRNPPIKFCFLLSEERDCVLDDYSPPLSFFYEPDVAVLKAGAFKSLAQAFNIVKLSVNTHLYTSDQLIVDFPGKIFKVKASTAYKLFIKEKRSGSFNIVSRNFPLTPEQIKKKHKLTDGGEEYLFFTTGSNGNLLTIEAERISS